MLTAATGQLAAKAAAVVLEASRPRGESNDVVQEARSSGSSGQLEFGRTGLIAPTDTNRSFGRYSCDMRNPLTGDAACHRAVNPMASRGSDDEARIGDVEKEWGQFVR